MKGNNINVIVLTQEQLNQAVSEFGDEVVKLNSEHKFVLLHNSSIPDLFPKLKHEHQIALNKLILNMNLHNYAVCQVNKT